MLLAQLLNRMIKRGTVTVIDAYGRTHVCSGTPANPGVTIRLHDPTLHWRLFLNPTLAAGEAYTDGSLTVEDGDLHDFLTVCCLNIGWGLPDHWLQTILNRCRLMTRRVMQYNPVGRAKKNVAHHYDLSDRLYDLFLDADRQYSCAYFGEPTDSLEQAQEQKKRHLAAKLLLQPGQRVLDIGSGWGGLGLHLARASDVEVLGVTLSEEQHKVANRRAEQDGLADVARFELTDYRQVEGEFDRIVSVGMFEHVGVNHYDEYFTKIRDLLTDDGVAVIHTIGRADGPGVTNAWIDKYIFPGGYSPALSEILPAIERTGLYVTDVEILRLHYAETLRAWRERFNEHRDEIRELYDERFCRMWEFYLVGSEMAFRYQGHVVFQIQMSKDQTAVPLTRDYITDYGRRRGAKNQSRAA